MADFHVIIPARLQSTRLEAKALKLIGDKPMIHHVCEQSQLSGAKTVTVATDDHTILKSVESAGYQAVMTRADHASGSDRVFEAAEIIGLANEDSIVNVQGDEPFIPPSNIRLVASLLDTNANMATLCCPIKTADEALDPNAVKVIFNTQGQAIYFSRSLIPYNRNQQVERGKPLASSYYRHIGIYAYRKSFLKSFINWPQSKLEKTESLEQLRVLENGASIAISPLTEMPPPGVDTPEDLEKARVYYASLTSN
ncbi:3-deoxy-manno-octulosonate cytidylyltransferase [Aliikangiella marina]|uniref:3-deoxy-manno-octulosonate cytidylyltransferase n=1 Tax=Aliikangiella marina TaxID=1712262 RepID=A0A545TJB2_9GAMM|nr:3-deoxy-manno-octulosonate cytidylyltransferase [Aliikangiella marina]TQV77305.1 3-deoxy-manno-octulosonate cytidylyltransferase [Aliikangiella marina]